MRNCLIYHKKKALIWYHERISLRLSCIYLELEAFDKSVDFAQWYLHHNVYSYHQKFQSRAMQNLGTTYLHLGVFDSAKYYFEESLELKLLSRDTLSLAIAYLNIANLYYVQYLDKAAIPLFEKGLEYARLAGDPKVYRDANLNMAVVEENRGRFQEALTYRKEYEKLQQELWDRDKVWELAEQEKKFQVSLKEKEINMLEQQRKLLHAELKVKLWQRNTAIIFSLVAILLITGIVWGYQRIKKANRTIAKQNHALNELNAVKNRLFSIISHDLKTPVLALQKSQQRLAASLGRQSLANIKQALAENAHSAGATYQLLNNLLHWSLEQSDQLTFVPATIALHRLVEQVLYDYQGPLKQKAITLVNEAAMAHISIHVDVNLMKTVLRNLLDNAVKYTPEQGLIKVAHMIGTHNVRLSVINSGPGIDQSLMQDIQLMMHKGASLTSARGTGLGLSLCQSIVKKHGGQLTIDSLPGERTSVHLHLPMAQKS